MVMSAATIRSVVYPHDAANAYTPTVPLHPSNTLRPFAQQLIYRAQMSESGWWLYLNPCKLLASALACNCCAICGQVSGNCCCYSRIRERSYMHVYENKIEVNYPDIVCCCLLNDHITVTLMDKVQSTTRAKYCTPFHLCGCLEFSGQVVATAPVDCLNCACCNCVREFYGGFDDADGFAAAVNKAKSAFDQGNRVLIPDILPPPLQVTMLR